MPLTALTEAAFRTASRLRGARAFHPRGVAFAATWHAGERGSLPIGSPLAQSGHRAVVRLSRGVGLPDTVPDILGLAVKVLDVHGPGREQDLLLASVGQGPMAHRVLRPTRGFVGTTFSSVLPYEVGDERTAVLAEVHGPGGWPFSRLAAAEGAPLEAALFLGSGGQFGRVVLGERLDDAVAADLRFDPWHTGPGLRPVGLVNRLRRPSYGASQSGRSAPATGARDRLTG